MSGLATLALVVLAAVGLLWTIVLIALLPAYQRTARRVESLATTLESDLRPLLQELREATRAVGQVARSVERAAPHLEAALGALEEAGENVRVATRAVRSAFGLRLIPVAGVLAGLRAGWRILMRRGGD
jgi:hypothetical protein